MARPSFWITGLVGGAALLSGSVPVQAQRALSRDPSASVDQLLEFTLSNLRERLREAVLNNEKLAGRNNILRGQVMDLQQDVRDLDRKKIVLLEAAKDLQASIKLSEQEADLRQRKLQDVARMMQEAEGVQTALRQRMEAASLKEKPLREDVQSFNEEIGALMQQMQASGTSGQGDFAKDKQELEDLMARSQSAQQAVARRVETMRQELRRLEGSRREIQDLRDQLKAKREAYQQAWDALRAEGRRLEEGGDGLTAERKERLRAFRMEVETLRQQRTQGLQAVSDLKTAAGQISEDRQAADLQRWRDDLVQQQRYLMLRKSKISGGPAEAVSRPEPLKDGRLESAQRHCEELRQDNQRLNAQWQEARRFHKTYPSEQKRMRRDIQSLERRLAAVPQSGQGDPAQERKLTRLSTDAQRQIQILTGEHQVLESGLGALQEEWTRIQDMNDDLNLAWSSQQAEWQALKAVSEQYQADIAKTAQAQEDLAREWQDMVQGLRLRKTALAASVEVVSAKYRDIAADKDGADSEDQLQEYLTVLKQENAALQDKVLNLTLEAEHLGRQKAAEEEKPESPAQEILP